MTAPALTNFFPGSPQVAGADSLVPTGNSPAPSSESQFAAMLGAAQTSQETPVQAPEETAIGHDTFQDLFSFLSLLWGESATQPETMSTDSEAQEAILDTNQPQTPPAESESQDVSGWDIGFVTELQVLLAMFQKLAEAFSGPVETAVPQGTETASSTPAPVQDTGTPLQVQAADVVASTSEPATVAPGIDLASEEILETTRATQGQAYIPTATYTPATEENNSSLPDADPTARDIPSKETADPQQLTSNASDKLVTDSSAGTRKDDISLHLMTMTYSRDKGLTLTDLKYSGTLSDGLSPGMSQEEQLALMDAVQFSQKDAIQFNRASIETSRGSLDLKSVFISPEAASQQAFSEAADSQTSQVQPMAVPADVSTDDVLTIDFTTGASTDSSSSSGDDPQLQGHTRQNPEQSVTPSSVAVLAMDNSEVSDASTSGRTEDLVTAQVREGITQALKMNKNRAVLHLNPPELGTVKVNITVSHNNSVHASFVADHPETRHILEANMQQLKDSLAQNGFSMAQVNVDVGSGFGQQWTGAQQEQLTPFGYPSMWLASQNQEETGESSAPSPSGIRPDGVHVIA